MISVELGECPKIHRHPSSRALRIILTTSRETSIHPLIWTTFPPQGHNQQEDPINKAEVSGKPTSTLSTNTFINNISVIPSPSVVPTQSTSHIYPHFLVSGSNFDRGCRVVWLVPDAVRSEVSFYPCLCKTVTCRGTAFVCFSSTVCRSRR
ncbi:hypothetical protein I7I50_05278 [Histoplasma capsulatum G186AR]|uniref:Uncharacterized protein n=1 Tax=Ajellomyces capsulatus TaxID=5037 RepID=A0A8H7ZC28_AJECA|nr:hypothetical protein I7I52_03537 [Histoplasma capsulatum]QSS75969.1 hypothetical protein I7I50_05278 [Histoplasma capsulatum G186AR]